MKLNGMYECCGSVQFSCSDMSNSLWPQRLQHTRPPCLSPTPRAYSNSCHWVGDAIQPSHPLSSPSPPAFNLSQHQCFLKWVSSSHQVKNWCSSTPQFKSIDSWCSAFFIIKLSCPYMTTRKTIDLTRQNLLTKLCLCFLICCLGWS